MAVRPGAGKPAALPFTVARGTGVGLVDQMVAGIKEAISCGRYRTGDKLPSFDELAAMAHVSRRVPKTAVARLLDEGWVTSLRRKGCYVSNPQTPIWKGRVLIVAVSDGNAQIGGTLQLRDSLERSRYFVQVVFVRSQSDGSFDLHSLKTALLGTFDLAYCHRPVKEVADCFAAARVPYVLACVRPRAEYLPGDEFYRGCICGDDGFLPDLVSAMKKAGVSRVAFVNFQDVFDRYAARLRRSGFTVEVVRTPVADVVVTPARVRDGAARFFAGRHVGPGGAPLPDVFLFMDDFVADGALCSLARDGVRIPEDVRVVTLYNNDVGLAYSANFARIEFDPANASNVCADYLLALLAGRRPAAPRTGFRFVPGDTL